MAVEDRLQAMLTEMKALREQERPMGHDLRGGGGGGTSGGGMEARIARIESDVEHLKADTADSKAELTKIRDKVGAIDATLTGLTVKVDHLPSKGFIFAIAAAMVTAAAGVTTIITKMVGS